jgi:hypothetical protein
MLLPRMRWRKVTWPRRLTSFRDSLTIAERLAEADTNYAGRQRDLSVSCEKVGDVLVEQSNLSETPKIYRDSLTEIDTLTSLR